MQLFKVKDAYELEQIKAKHINEGLNNESVFIISDDNAKALYLYKGAKASFPLMMIGANFCKEYRKQMKGFYKIYDFSLLQESEQKSILDSKITDGRLKPILNPNASIQFARIVDADGKQEYIIESWSKYLTDSEDSVFTKTRIADVFKKIYSSKSPPGYVREAIIIDCVYYIPTTEIEQTLEGRKIHHKFKKAGFVPDGIFFEEADATRIQFANGKIEYIELLRKEQNISKLGRVLAPVFFDEPIIYKRSTDDLKKALQKGTNSA